MARMFAWKDSGISFGLLSFSHAINPSEWLLIYKPSFLLLCLPLHYLATHLHLQLQLPTFKKVTYYHYYCMHFGIVVSVAVPITTTTPRPPFCIVCWVAVWFGWPRINCNEKRIWNKHIKQCLTNVRNCKTVCYYRFLNSLCNLIGSWPCLYHTI